MAKPSKKTPTRTRKTRKAPAKPQAVTPAVEEPGGPSPDAAPSTEAAAEGATVAQPEEISLGPVECRQMRVSLGSVLGLLSDDSLRRVEAHKESPTFESTRKRLLATDGRATPVFFEAGKDKKSPPSILHGFDELAAAQVCGIPEISVILVPPGGADAAQSHIVEMVRQQREAKPSEDDELFYRVHAED